MPPSPNNPAVALEIELWLRQAAAHRSGGRLPDALALYQKVLSRAPGHPDALREMGVAALDTGAIEVAEGFLDQAVKAAPKSVPALVARARAALASGRPGKAIAALQRAARVSPRTPEVALLMGDAYLDSGDIVAARRAFRDAARLDPADARAAHMAAALQEDAGSDARNAYAAALFDQYADIFDSHLVAALGYDAPAELRRLADEIAPERRFSTGLDLGCGTGLVAEAFSGRVDSMHGVDISPRMVAAARAKGLYERLEAADLEDYLDREKPGLYDLAIAADVFIYVGTLERSFAGVAKALRPGGLFLLSIEQATTRDVEVRSSGRFAHAQGHIEQLARAHDLTILRTQENVLRTENGRPLAGRLFALERN